VYHKYINNTLVVPCGLQKEESDDGATRGLISTHVEKIEQKKKGSQVFFVFLPK
jgi:hypothetical protein